MKFKGQLPTPPPRRRALFKNAPLAALATLLLISGLGSFVHAADASSPNPAPAPPSKPAASVATTGKAAEPAFETTKIDRPTFSLTYPTTWTEDKNAATYDPNANFTLVSPKYSYVQFSIMGTADDPAKIVSDTLKKLDGPTITSLSKVKLDSWGNHKGTGYHLKGKILGSYPGGIKVFVFTSGKHNILVTEFYYADELKDVLADFDYISLHFTMKN